MLQSRGTVLKVTMGFIVTVVNAVAEVCFPCDILKKIDQNLEALAKTWHREQPLLLFRCQGRQPAGSGCIPTAAGTPGWRERI